MKLTPVRQRNAVSEGMALGFVVLGHYEIDFDKIGVDLAFGHAWRRWSYARRFPQVSADLRNGLDPYIAMTRASEGKRTVSFYWELGRTLKVVPRRYDFDDQSEDDLIWAAEMVDGDVPLEGWISLARMFKDNYESA